MACDGWVKLHRQIQDSQLWTRETFTRGQAWIDLIILANHKPGYFFNRDHKINVARGQVGWSQLQLSRRWKWSRTKTKNFLKLLETEQQIVVENSKSNSIITIVNYEKYQQKEQQESNRKATEKQQKSTNKNDKNEKKKEYSDRFLKFWSEYPRKNGKAKAYSSWKKYNCDNGIFETIMNSLSKHKKSEDWQRDGGRYIPPRLNMGER